jgi:hypothetical protein
MGTREGTVDALIDARLQEQEVALRAVLTLLGQTHREVRLLQRAAGWHGPAASAYDSALRMLEARLGLAEERLREALRETADAIITRACCG